MYINIGKKHPAVYLAPALAELDMTGKVEINALGAVTPIALELSMMLDKMGHSRNSVQVFYKAMPLSRLVEGKREETGQTHDVPGLKILHTKRSATPTVKQEPEDGTRS